ncbi:MAG: CDP-alcohol phosphatidyltransferase family protein [Candidatus Margulisiibacteriota bacterium]
MKKASITAHLFTIVITLANAVCGIIAGLYLIKYALLRNTPGIFAEKYLTLVWVFALLGGIFDYLDGRIARLTGTSSKFGVQLDSLCDAVTYGVIAALFIAVLNSFGTHPYWEKFSWFCAIVYLSGVLLRLARYNVETRPEEKHHLKFRGLPSPAAAGMIAAIGVLFLGLRDGNILFTNILWEIFSKGSVIQFSNYLIAALPFIGLGLAFLMVSKIQYYHLHAFFRSLKGKKPFVYLAYILIAFLLIAVFREITLSLFGISFFFYGLISYFYDLLTGKSKKSGKA